jgi:hypothetical protein
VKWGKDLPDYMSQAICCQDFTNLVIRDFSGTSASSGYPAIRLQDGRGVILENNRSGDKNLKLIEQINIAR